VKPGFAKRAASTLEREQVGNDLAAPVKRTISPLPSSIRNVWPRPAPEQISKALIPNTVELRERGCR
jgi:hypothetical protein